MQITMTSIKAAHIMGFVLLMVSVALQCIKKQTLFIRISECFKPVD